MSSLACRNGALKPTTSALLMPPQAASAARGPTASASSASPVRFSSWVSEQRRGSVGGCAGWRPGRGGGGWQHIRKQAAGVQKATRHAGLEGWACHARPPWAHTVGGGDFVVSSIAGPCGREGVRRPRGRPASCTASCAAPALTDAWVIECPPISQPLSYMSRSRSQSAGRGGEGADERELAGVRWLPMPGCLSCSLAASRCCRADKGRRGGHHEALPACTACV